MGIRIFLPSNFLSDLGQSMVFEPNELNNPRPAGSAAVSAARGIATFHAPNPHLPSFDVGRSPRGILAKRTEQNRRFSRETRFSEPIGLAGLRISRTLFACPHTVLSRPGSIAQSPTKASLGAWREGVKISRWRKANGVRQHLGLRAALLPLSPASLLAQRPRDKVERGGSAHAVAPRL